MTLTVQEALQRVSDAKTSGKIIAGAEENLRKWLTESRYSLYLNQVLEHIEKGDWKTLDDVFWTVIPFGTGGRRGKMYPIGSNAINDRTIGESAQGLADYLRSQFGAKEMSCGIAYDTRNNSRHFAELCASIMVANGFTVYFLDDYRSTPELSYLVRAKKCDCGIMVTASHNPPSDNAVKVYWSTGGQLVPPHDENVIKAVEGVQEIKTVSFADSVKKGKVLIVTEEIDRGLLEEHKKQSLCQERGIKVIYSPLHGVGEKNVVDALHAVGFKDVEVFGPHRERDGNFPNVPKHVSNPENPDVFNSIIERAKQVGADLVLATDPDCDRMGAAAPVSLAAGSEWKTFTGNQLGALLVDYVLSQKKKAGQLTKDHYIIKTLVTTELAARIAESYGVRVEGNLHVGFKWIGEKMDEVGPDKFLIGTEESHGYLVGQYARDKDGAVACLLMAEVAAVTKAAGMSLHEKLNQLYLQHGYHAEDLINIQMTGSDGMRRMDALMAALRAESPKVVGGLKVAQVRDYKSLTTKLANGTTVSLASRKANMIIIDLEQQGNYVAVRPSGTEPKVKLYMFTASPVKSASDLNSVGQQMKQRLSGFAADLQKIADSIK